jgi:hypothetical protein
MRTIYFLYENFHLAFQDIFQNWQFSLVKNWIFNPYYLCVKLISIHLRFYGMISTRGDKSWMRKSQS